MNAALVTNMLVDGCGRIGRFLPGLPQKAREGKHITWEAIKFMMFPSKKAHDISIKVKITCKWLKNASHDSQKFKQFPLRVLPANFVLWDTARLLVIHALLSNAFKDFQSWKQLKQCNPAERGEPDIGTLILLQIIITLEILLLESQIQLAIHSR
jgi:hypothetical protein